MGLYSSLTSTDVGNYGTDIGDSTIVSALQALDDVNAPMDDRYFVIKPSQKAALMKLDKFVASSFLGSYDQPSPIVKGPNTRYFWGDTYGVPTYYTTQVTTTAGTPTQTHNLLFHKEAFVLALQSAPRTQASYWQKDLAWIVTVDAIYGYTALRTTFGIEVRS